jgi:acyl-CoA synthetase (AMP-forming)/AMP-acid ligase II
MSVAVVALGPVMSEEHAATQRPARWSHRLARGVVLAARTLAPVIVRSQLPEVTIPDVTLAEFVLQRAAELGDKPALIDGPSGRTLTYGELANGVERLAAGLAAQGHRRGDVIGLFAPNIPEYALVFLAIARLGGVITTFNSLATVEDLAQQLRDAGASGIVTVPPFLDRALPAADAAGLEHRYVIGQADGATSISNLMNDVGAKPDGPTSPDDLVVLPYSSGTTGLPKGVMLSHRNLVTNTIQIGVQQDVREDERLIGILPFFHIYGMTVVMNLALSRGATIVTMPRFELDGFLDLMERHRITRAMLVPPIILALAKHPAVEGRDFSALELIMSGAAPLDAGIEVACAERLGCLVVQGYGMTEASPVTHATSDVEGTAKPGSIGPLLPNTEARIVDVATGDDLGTDVDGELLIRGPQVMRGYLNNPEATSRTLDSDGWLHSGDVARVDADGYFTIVDRLKELIKFKGYQVAPAELEAVLVGHPAVTDAAVIPMHDDEAGEVPKAFVVLAAPVGADELIAYVGARVAPYKRIRQVEVIDAIPKSSSGKILRRELVARERERERAAAG